MTMIRAILIFRPQKEEDFVYDKETQRSSFFVIH